MNDDAYVYLFLFSMIFKREKTTKIHLKNRQTSSSIYEFSKTTKLPMNDDVYVYFFLFSMIFKREKTTKIPLKNRLTSTSI